MCWWSTTWRKESELDDLEARGVKMIEMLRKERDRLSPAKLAELLEDPKCSIGLRPSTFMAYFLQAFPEIPIRVLWTASRWHRIAKHGESDEVFNRILSPWLGPDSKSGPG